MPTMLTVGMEGQMVAYWVARSKVNNPEQHKKYTEHVIEFPSFEKAVVESI